MTKKIDSAERMNPLVDRFLGNAKKWQEELRKLRAIALGFGFTEELKWGKPCYSLDGKNIAILQGFKDYCALMFFKGALLKDPKKILATPGEHQSARQIRFTDLQEVVAREPVVKAYIREAIEVEKAGLKVKLRKTSEFKIPEEFQTRLKKNRALEAAFEALTPGRQRAYLFHFAQPKLSATRAARVEKWTPQILSGKGMDD